MKNGRGKAADLKSAVDAAVQSNGNLAVLEGAYWSTRTTNELANFDTRVQRAADGIALLSGRGYDTAAAQAQLGEITAQRPVLESALNSHERTQIQAVEQQILTLSQQLAQIVKDLQVQVPQEKKIRFHISEGNRAVARTDMVNADLKSLDIDTTQAEQYTASARADLAAAETALGSQDLAGAQAALDRAKADLKNLSQAYRDIAKRYQQDTATVDDLTATATALDSLTASMESGA
jgi:chromosome segregation ATPase